MVTNDTLTAMLQGKSKAYIFLYKGRVQFWQMGEGTGPIVATSWQAAKVIAADMKKKNGQRVSIAEIGTVEGESLSRHIAVAVISYDATGVFVTDDGKAVSYFQAPPIPDDEE